MFSKPAAPCACHRRCQCYYHRLFAWVARNSQQRINQKISHLTVWDTQLRYLTRTFNHYNLVGARSGSCNWSYCEAGIWGWLESSFKAAGALRAAAPDLGSILNPPGMRIGPGGSVVVIGTLLSDQIPNLLSSRIGGVKSQLLCGVRIELAVGFLPNPRQSGAQTVW